jgi:cold shock CspA family protein
MSDRLTGTVTTFDRRRRYGFIASDHAGRFFFHADDVQGALPDPGARVGFAPDPTAPRGPRASAVRALSADPPLPDAA